MKAKIMKVLTDTSIPIIEETKRKKMELENEEKRKHEIEQQIQKTILLNKRYDEILNYIELAARNGKYHTKIRCDNNDDTNLITEKLKNDGFNVNIKLVYDNYHNYDCDGGYLGLSTNTYYAYYIEWDKL